MKKEVRRYPVTSREFINIHDEDAVCQSVLNQISSIYAECRVMNMSFAEMLPLHISVNQCGDEPEILLKITSMRIERREDV